MSVVLALSLVACSPPDASDVSFDPATSGLAADNVQAAIDAEATARLALDAAHQSTVGTVEAHDLSISALTDALGLMQGAIDSVTARIDALTASEVAFDDTSSQLGASDTQAAIDAVYVWAQAQTAGLIADVGALDTRLTSVEAEVASLAAELGSVEGDVVSLAAELGSVEGDVASLDTLTAALDAGLTAAETDIGTVQSELACPAGTIAVNGGCIDTDERSASLAGCSQFLEAVQDCASDGLRLCTTSEWMGACYAGPAALNDMSGNYEIVADLASAGTFIIVGQVGCSNVSEAACGTDGNIGQPLVYRCCR